MKKLLLTLFCLCLLIFSTACNYKPDFSQQISQLRSEILTAETEQLFISCYIEEREQNYNNDGYVGQIEKVIIIKMTSKSQINENLQCNFYTDKVYNFEIEKNDLSFGAVAVFHVEQLPTSMLVLSVNNEKINLCSIATENTINYQDALIKVSEQKSQLFENIESCEIHIRLICESNKLFWYIGIIDKSTTNAFLVDATTCEIVAEKIINNEN